jgi:hypothetical protein
MGLDPFGHPGQPGTAAAVKFEGRGSSWPVGDVDVQAGGLRLQGHRYGRARGVLHGVGKPFLDDAHGVGSHGRREHVLSGRAEGDVSSGRPDRVDQVAGELEQ